MRNFRHIMFWIAFLGSATSVFAQRTHDQAWISVGGGLSARELFLGASQGLAVSYNSGSLFLSARLVNADRFDIAIGGPGTPYLDNIQEYTINFGYAKHSDNALYLASIGVGRLQGKYNKERQNASFRTLCIPVTGQILWKLSPAFGIGPLFSVNFNGREIFVGVWFNLQITVIV